MTHGEIINRFVEAIQDAAIYQHGYAGELFSEDELVNFDEKTKELVIPTKYIRNGKRVCIIADNVRVEDL